MPSFFFNPFSSQRSGPRVVNPMVNSLPKPEPSKEPAPCLPSLPDISSDSGSIMNTSIPDSESSERPGKLKVIGGSDDDAKPKPDEYKVPEIDFGPTFNFAAKELPKDKLRAIAGDSYGSRANTADDSKHKSMNEQWRRINASSSALNARPGTVASHYRNVSRESLIGEHPHLQHHRRRSSTAFLSHGNTAGSPAGAYSRTPPRSTTALPLTPRRMLTPESIDQGSHSRSHSYSSQPHSRSHSQSVSQAHLRKQSVDSYAQSARPYSRNAAPTLVEQQAVRPDLVSHLSAREQEHVARLTGGPLISLVTTPTRQANSSAVGGTSSPSRGHEQSPSVGLVGAIDARQREKEQLKASGAYNPSVAYALRERQQQIAMQQMQMAQAQSLAFQNQQMQMQFQAQWEQQQMQQQIQQQQQQMAMMAATPRAMTANGMYPMHGMPTSATVGSGLGSMAAQQQQRRPFLAAGASGY
ncbi:uncharacterized protein BROUX77_000509 [Berkeleyomyces rouxiae]|uniref:uncharacterized protein n=1 Tax=Berkeleyomyces rouxiae TaxID=2035830 RepID=UPI003B772CB7